MSEATATGSKGLTNGLLKYGLLASVVSCVYLYLRTQGKRKREWQRRFFAWIFSKYSSPSLVKALDPLKRELFSPLKDMLSADPSLSRRGPGCLRILEIGIGNGANLKYYPPGCLLVSVEPNPFFEKHFEANLSLYEHIRVETFVEGVAEDMSLVASGTIDVVVSTHVLCSVDDVQKSLEEIKRVLVSGGKFLYVEHVAYNKSRVSHQMQRLVEPFWVLFSDNCLLTRDLSRSISDIGFHKVEEIIFFPRDVYYVMRPHIIGTATKALSHIIN